MRVLALLIPLFTSLVLPSQVRVVQISDTHIGASAAPAATTNLNKIVAKINALTPRPDAVIVSGDVGESSVYRLTARSILSQLKLPIHYVPGNHDTNGLDLASWHSIFGPDYYTFTIKNVRFIAVDSQVLGNWSNFNATTAPAVSSTVATEADIMLAWMRGLHSTSHSGSGSGKNQITIAFQHVPLVPAVGFPGPRPYWVISEPYRSREFQALQQLGVRHVLVGHWHKFMTFSAQGITFHVDAATSYSPFGAPLGFSVHDISSSGNVNSHFVPLN